MHILFFFFLSIVLILTEGPLLTCKLFLAHIDKLVKTFSFGLRSTTLSLVQSFPTLNQYNTCRVGEREAQLTLSVKRWIMSLLLLLYTHVIMLDGQFVLVLIVLW